MRRCSTIIKSKFHSRYSNSQWRKFRLGHICILLWILSNVKGLRRAAICARRFLQLRFRVARSSSVTAASLCHLGRQNRTAQTLQPDWYDHWHYYTGCLVELTENDHFGQTTSLLSWSSSHVGLLRLFRKIYSLKPRKQTTTSNDSSKFFWLRHVSSLIIFWLVQSLWLEFALQVIGSIDVNVSRSMLDELFSGKRSHQNHPFDMNNITSTEQRENQPSSNSLFTSGIRFNRGQICNSA